MTSLQYVGPAASTNREIVTKLSVEQALSTGVTRTYVDDKVQERADQLAQVSYVDAQDSLRVNKSYVNTQDGLLIPFTQQGSANGVTPLDSSAKVPQAYIPKGKMGAGMFRGPYQLTSKNSNVNAGAQSYAQLCQFSYVAPGFWWRPLVFGNVVGLSDGPSRPDIIVVVGSNPGTTGMCAGGHAMNYSSYASICVQPSTIQTGMTGMPVTGYNQTANVVVTVFLYNPFTGTANVANTTDYDFVLYLVGIVDQPTAPIDN